MGSGTLLLTRDETLLVCVRRVLGRLVGWLSALFLFDVLYPDALSPSITIRSSTNFYEAKFRGEVFIFDECVYRGINYF